MPDAVSAPQVSQALAPSRRLPRWWIVIAALLAIAKLVLVSTDEIERHAADDTGNAIVAAQWYWGNPYQNYSYTRQPVYPLFIAASSALGVPVRLMTELVWIGAAGMLALAMRRSGISSLGVLGTYVLVLFHPIAFWLFNRLLPDGLFAALTLGLVAALWAGLLASSRGSVWRWGLSASACAALAANTRQESPLVLGVVLVAGVLSLLGAWRGWCVVPGGSARWTRTRLAALVLAPVLCTAALTHAFKLANQQRIGLYVTYDLVAPGLRSLYGALLEIPPKSPSLLLPIPRDVRDLAYAHSPTFKRIEPFLDGDKAPKDYMNACKNHTGVDGEYGAWTVWALRRSAWVMNEYRWTSGGEMDEYFAQCARELREAMKVGSLPRRWVPHEYLPPEWGLLARQMPTSVLACWQQMKSISLQPVASEKLEPWYAARLDSTALRRLPLVALSDGAEPPPTLWHTPGVVQRLTSVKLAIVKTGEWLTRAGLVAGIVGALLAIPLWRRARKSEVSHALLIGIALLASVIVSRTLLFAVLDANGIPAQQRYLFVASVLLLVLLPLVIEACSTLARDSRSAQR